MFKPLQICDHEHRFNDIGDIVWKNVTGVIAYDLVFGFVM